MFETLLAKMNDIEAAEAGVKRSAGAATFCSNAMLRWDVRMCVCRRGEGGRNWKQRLA